MMRLYVLVSPHSVKKVGLPKNGVLPNIYICNLQG